MCRLSISEYHVVVCGVVYAMRWGMNVVIAWSFVDMRSALPPLYVSGLSFVELTSLLTGLW